MPIKTKKHTDDIANLLKYYKFNEKNVYQHYDQFSGIYKDDRSYQRAVRKIKKRDRPDLKVSKLPISEKNMKILLNIEKENIKKRKDLLDLTKKENILLKDKIKLEKEKYKKDILTKKENIKLDNEKYKQDVLIKKENIKLDVLKKKAITTKKKEDIKQIQLDYSKQILPKKFEYDTLRTKRMLEVEKLKEKEYELLNPIKERRLPLDAKIAKLKIRQDKRKYKKERRKEIYATGKSWLTKGVLLGILTTGLYKFKDELLSGLKNLFFSKADPKKDSIIEKAKDVAVKTTLKAGLDITKSGLNIVKDTKNLIKLAKTGGVKNALKVGKKGLSMYGKAPLGVAGSMFKGLGMGILSETTSHYAKKGLGIKEGTGKSIATDQIINSILYSNPYLATLFSVHDIAKHGIHTSSRIEDITKGSMTNIGDIQKKKIEQYIKKKDEEDFSINDILDVDLTKARYEGKQRLTISSMVDLLKVTQPGTKMFENRVGELEKQFKTDYIRMKGYDKEDFKDEIQQMINLAKELVDFSKNITSKNDDLIKKLEGWGVNVVNNSVNSTNNTILNSQQTGYVSKSRSDSFSMLGIN